MLISYARVSTDDQNPDLQRVALEKACCEKSTPISKMVRIAIDSV